jgi:ABC-type branched-subunit amino acid transport system substrate-binding protein
MRTRLLLTIVVAMGLLLAACGSSNKSSSGGSPTSTAPAYTPTKTLGTGVTDKAIKIGIALSDFKCIENIPDAVQQIRTNQQQNYQVYIDAINNSGGVDGRMLDPVYDEFCPIPNATLYAQVCTHFTDDEHVFAVLGNFYDPSGVAQACLAKTHKTIFIGFDLTRAIVSKSPPGMVIYPGSFPERADAALGELLQQDNKLQGKTVGILADSSAKEVVKEGITPILKKLGVKQGSTATLQAAGADTTAAQAQLDAAIAKWQSEGVDTVWITGENVASAIFVKKLRAKMPNVELVTDVGDTDTFGQGQQEAGANPNPYTGLLTANGITKDEYIKGPNWKHCNDIWKAAHNGADAPTNPLPNPGGLPIDQYGSINDACQVTALFHDIAAKVGPYLNDNNWVHTVDTFGPITNYGGGPYASLSLNKYDIDDTFRLVEFDPTIPPHGDWKPLTDMKNISS